MQIRLGLLVVVLLLLMMLSACQEDWVDDCSIPQEKIDHPPENAIPYTFTNQSCLPITCIYVTPNRCDYWGLDWTGKKVLHPGDSFTIRLPKGRYAIHYEDAFGYPDYYYNWKIRDGGVFRIGNADGSSMEDCQASVTINNQSDQTFTGFYIDQSGGFNWLGDDSIPPGESFQFLIFPAIIDIKVTVGEFEDFYLQKDVTVDHHITLEVTGD